MSAVPGAWEACRRAARARAVGCRRGGTFTNLLQLYLGLVTYLQYCRVDAHTVLTDHSDVHVCACVCVQHRAPGSHRPPAAARTRGSTIQTIGMCAVRTVTPAGLAPGPCVLGDCNCRAGVTTNESERMPGRIRPELHNRSAQTDAAVAQERSSLEPPTQDARPGAECARRCVE